MLGADAEGRQRLGQGSLAAIGGLAGGVPCRLMAQRGADASLGPMAVARARLMSPRRRGRGTLAAFAARVPGSWPGGGCRRLGRHGPRSRPLADRSRATCLGRCRRAVAHQACLDRQRGHPSRCRRRPCRQRRRRLLPRSGCAWRDTDARRLRSGMPSGAMARQAARFRVFGYDADGKVVGEITSADATIAWNVHLANRKAAWYDFVKALDIPEAVPVQQAQPDPHRQRSQRARRRCRQPRVPRRIGGGDAGDRARRQAAARRAAHRQQGTPAGAGGPRRCPCLVGGTVDHVRQQRWLA